MSFNTELLTLDIDQKATLKEVQTLPLKGRIEPVNDGDYNWPGAIPITPVEEISVEPHSGDAFGMPQPGEGGRWYRLGLSMVPELQQEGVQVVGFTLGFEVKQQGGYGGFGRRNGKARLRCLFAAGLEAPTIEEKANGAEEGQRLQTEVSACAISSVCFKLSWRDSDLCEALVKLFHEPVALFRLYLH